MTWLLQVNCTSGIILVQDEGSTWYINFVKHTLNIFLQMQNIQSITVQHLWALKIKINYLFSFFLFNLVQPLLNSLPLFVIGGSRLIPQLVIFPFPLSNKIFFFVIMVTILFSFYDLNQIKHLISNNFCQHYFLLYQIPFFRFYNLNQTST